MPRAARTAQVAGTSSLSTLHGLPISAQRVRPEPLSRWRRPAAATRATETHRAGAVGFPAVTRRRARGAFPPLANGSTVARRGPARPGPARTRPWTVRAPPDPAGLAALGPRGSRQEAPHRLPTLRSLLGAAQGAAGGCGGAGRGGHRGSGDSIPPGCGVLGEALTQYPRDPGVGLGQFHLGFLVRGECI